MLLVASFRDTCDTKMYYMCYKTVRDATNAYCEDSMHRSTASSHHAHIQHTPSNTTLHHHTCQSNSHHLLPLTSLLLPCWVFFTCSFIEQHEPFDRGFYAGPFGWVSGRGAEFAVAIRSALLPTTGVDPTSTATSAPHLQARVLPARCITPCCCCCCYFCAWAVWH